MLLWCTCSSLPLLRTYFNHTNEIVHLYSYARLNIYGKKWVQNYDKIEVPIYPEKLFVSLDITKMNSY